MDFKPLKDIHELDFGLVVSGQRCADFEFRRPTQRIKLAIGEAKASLKETPGRMVIEVLRLSLKRICGQDLDGMKPDAATEFLARLKYPDVMTLLYKRYELRRHGIMTLPGLDCPACGGYIDSPAIEIGNIPVYAGKSETVKIALSGPIQVGTMTYSELSVTVPSWRESVMKMSLKAWNNPAAWRWAVARAAIAEPIPEDMLLDLDESDAERIDTALDEMSGSVVPVAKYYHVDCQKEIGVKLDWTDADFV